MATDPTDQQMEQEFLLPTTETAPTLDPEPPEEDGEEPKEAQTVEELPEWARKELSKARRDAAKYRNAAKETSKSSQVDEKAIRTQIRAEMLTEVASAKIEAALTGIVEDPSSIVEDLDLSRYIDEDGIDDDAIAALKSKYQRIVKRPGVGQGRTNGKPQGTAADQFAATLRSLGA